MANKLHFYFFLLLVFFSIDNYAQNYTITGKVFDAESKEPLPFVPVLIKGTTVGTTTDDTGYYQLKLTNNYDSISAAYLGYTEGTQAIKKQPKQRIDFLLEASQSLRAAAGGQGGPAPGGDAPKGGKPNDDVVDAEFTEVDDKR